MRNALPNGQRAARPGTSTEVIPCVPPGVEFLKFGLIGSVGEDLAPMVRGEGIRLYLVIDDKSIHLETRTSCADPLPLGPTKAKTSRLAERAGTRRALPTRLRRSFEKSGRRTYVKWRSCRSNNMRRRLSRARGPLVATRISGARARRLSLQNSRRYRKKHL